MSTKMATQSKERDDESGKYREMRFHRMLIKCHSTKEKID